MLEPNIQFHPDRDDLTSLFTDVFKNIGEQLDKYDLIDQKYQNSIKSGEHLKLRSKMKTISTELSSSENHTDSISATIDQMSKWFNELEETRNIMSCVDNIKIPDDFIIKFGNSHRMMKNLGKEILPALSDFMDSYETRNVLHLKEVLFSKRKQRNSRNEMLDKLSNYFSEADKKYNDVNNEYKNLDKEYQKLSSTLEELSSSESFEMIQQAKRQKYVTEEWETKKEKLVNEINSLTNTYNAFRNGHNSKSKGEIVKRANEIDEEYTKAEAKWEEEIRIVNEDMRLSLSNIEAMKKQLEKDLVAAQFQTLATEKNKTLTIVRTTKGSSDRTTAKFTNTKNKSNRQLEMNLKKKGMNVQYAIEIMKQSHADDIELIKSIMENTVNDIKNIVARKKENESLKAEVTINNLVQSIEMLKATCENANKRINQRMIEKDIELNSINNRLATVQGVVDDISEQSQLFEKKHETLENEMRTNLEKTDFEKTRLKNEIEKDTIFITAVNKFIEYISSLSEKKMEPKDQLPKKITIKRSNSQIFEKQSPEEFLNNERTKMIRNRNKASTKNPLIHIPKASKSSFEYESKNDIKQSESNHSLTNFPVKDYTNSSSKKELKNNEIKSLNHTIQHESTIEQSQIHAKIVKNEIQESDISHPQENDEIHHLSDTDLTNHGQMLEEDITVSISDDNVQDNEFIGVEQRLCEIEQNDFNDHQENNENQNTKNEIDQNEINLKQSSDSNISEKIKRYHNDKNDIIIPIEPTCDATHPYAIESISAPHSDTDCEYQIETSSEKHSYLQSKFSKEDHKTVDISSSESSIRSNDSFVNHENISIDNINDNEINHIESESLSEENLMFHHSSNSEALTIQQKSEINRDKIEESLRLLQEIYVSTQNDELKREIVQETPQTIVDEGFHLPKPPIRPVSPQTPIFVKSYITEFPVTQQLDQSPKINQQKPEKIIQNSVKLGSKLNKKFETSTDHGFRFNKAPRNTEKKIPNNQPSFVSKRSPGRIKNQIKNNTSIDSQTDQNSHSKTSTNRNNLFSFHYNEMPFLDPRSKFEIWYDNDKVQLNKNSTKVNKAVKATKTKSKFKSPRKTKFRRSSSTSKNELEFNQTCSERRACSVRKVPKKEYIDSMISSGSLNLHNRMNGCMISIRKI
ncbi:hypothetical protein TRFO_13886 [Tritrichomonas foetus]|uniref:Uncharacterized protein n=1 Tax=Tritrichomonas foetus TaxID=1144522 RepID=A0A1J4KXV4_9EUKA|nr:hypothetical protein TRFO_13886 [Tritrichomonas foetus]|eukprot:OHT15720.1 hypothetical protein TRFO_13886 [Tritrichomonas foetus]